MCMFVFKRILVGSAMVSVVYSYVFSFPSAIVEENLVCFDHIPCACNFHFERTTVYICICTLI